MDRIDHDAARRKVAAWMTAHPDGTPEQMADDLKGQYGQFAGDMAIVLRGLMARFQDHPGELTAHSRPLACGQHRRPPQPPGHRSGAGRRNTQLPSPVGAPWCNA